MVRDPDILDRLGALLDRLAPYLIFALFLMAAVGVASAQDMMRVVRGGWRREEAAPAGPTNIPQFASSITWYRFNEFTNSAGKHVDSSAVGTNTAVPAAGGAMPTWISASQGIYLNGSDYSSQDVGFILNGLTQLTYSIWVSNEVWSAYDGLICSRGTAMLGLSFEDTANELFFYVNAGGLARSTTNFANWTNANWTHIAATYDFTTKGIYVYMNGTQTLYSTTTQTNAQLSGQTDVVKIGFDDANAAYKFTGNIDDPLIYNTALTSNEVYQLYQFGH